MRVFEKLDGTNVGIRFERDRRLVVTPRSVGERLPVDLPDRFGLQGVWTVRRLPALWALLGHRFEAYGEWLADAERVYRRLPDQLLFFDLLDLRRRRFLGRAEAMRRLRRAGFCPNPVLFHGRIRGTADLSRVGRSVLGCKRPEGWIVEARAERFKFVR